MQHIPDLYADIDLQMLKRKVQALESAITNPKRGWVVLTDEEIEEVYETTTQQTLRPQDRHFVLLVTRAIEAKLRSKNT
jgi:bifunctional pyridoxal-dependent enzyme with beta-cystathionase and maltose regulon repressor activities